MKHKRHGAAWWLFIGWWWYPCKWLFYSIPRFILKQSKNPPKINAQPLQKSQAITTPPKKTQTPENKAQDVPQPQLQPKPANKVETHKVAGISFRMDAVEALGVLNEDYRLSKRQLIDYGQTFERIYKTDYLVGKVELVPEPDNPHDSNAIKVVCDGQHIGYIKGGSCAHVHKLLREDRILKIEAEVVGGPYKVLLEEDISEAGEPVYRLEEGTAPHHAKILITEK